MTRSALIVTNLPKGRAMSQPHLSKLKTAAQTVMGRPTTTAKKTDSAAKPGNPSERNRATSAPVGTRLYHHVANDLGARIVKGEFLPGMLLPNENECGQTYQVSRTAVREAVKMLTAKGLVQSRPKVGSRVEPREAWNLLDPDVLDWYMAAVPFEEFAADVQQLRRMFEPEAAALAAASRSEAHLATIQEAYQRMADADDQTSWNTADVAFHRAILDASGNALLAPFGRVIEVLLRNLFAYTFRAADPKSTLPEHAAVLSAIERQRPSAARKATLNLLNDTDAILVSMAEHPGSVLIERLRRGKG
jgi:DNA-binding FadR family transcriptional regulator